MPYTGIAKLSQWRQPGRAAAARVSLWGQSGSGAPRDGGSALLEPLIADPAQWFAELDGLGWNASSARAKSLTSRWSLMRRA